MTRSAAVDLDALARRAASDPQAMTEFVRHSALTVHRVCAALVDTSTAEDLAQETLARAVRSLPTFRGDASARTWLIAIARRVCADEVARRQRARALEVKLRNRRYTSADPCRVVDVTDALDRLPAERREAFVLTALAGLSYAEAAAACGCPVGTIRSRVARARDDLIRLLADDERWVAAS